jgi:sialate O-acetylesterase
MLTTMVEAWRRALCDDTLPFYVVQLPGHPSDIGDWAVLREKQEQFCKQDAHARLITMPETGEAKMIHPARKAGVAEALSRAVAVDLWGAREEYSGPVAERFERITDGLRITFSHADGLHILGRHMTDTYVYDYRGVAATVFAEIEGNVLTLTWWKGLRVSRVSMGYGNEPYHNLYNAAGYLASPFNYDYTAVSGENDMPTF